MNEVFRTAWRTILRLREPLAAMGPDELATLIDPSHPVRSLILTGIWFSYVRLLPWWRKRRQ